MREVISLNGMLTLPGAVEPTRQTAPWPVSSPQLFMDADFCAFSRPGWLPNCQLVLGGEQYPMMMALIAFVTYAVCERGTTDILLA